MHVPRRRCIGCGRIAPKSELLRVAVLRGGARPSRAVHDTTGTMPGRGAYLCAGVLGAPAATECLERATGRGAFNRALRCTVTIDPKLESIST